MYKKITTWSVKGGVGKTSICSELHFRLGYPVITNERYSMLPSVIDGKLLKILKENESIEKYTNNIIFDFGGYVDSRIISALQQSNCVIIPVTTNAIDIQGCIDTIKSITKYNDNIIIVINRVRNKKDIDFVKSALNKLKNFKYFVINDSKAISNIFRKRSSVKDMMNNPLLKYAYRNINNQIILLEEYILNI